MVVRVLITGSREFTHRPTVAAALKAEWVEHGRQPMVVVHGTARGGDSLAAAVTRDLPDSVAVEEPHPADWRPNGGPLDRGAGHKRNAEMVKAGADVCLAFYKSDAGNVGTRACVALAKRAGIPVREFWQE